MAIYDIPFLSATTNAFAGAATFGGSQVSLTANGAEFNTTYAGVTTTRFKTDASGGLLSVDGTNALRLRSNGVDRLTVVAGTGAIAVSGAFGVAGITTANGVSRALGSGGAAGTAAGWRFGDTNSGSSRDWSISNGIGGGGAAIGALVFSISTALSGDPLAAGSEVLRLASGAVTATGSLKATTGFGCNGAAAQTAFASGGALAAYGAGANGFDTAGHASALYALVVAIRAALVACGIMS